MGLKNLFAWGHKAQNTAPSCGTACGAGDPKPSACGSACGAGDPKPSACGSACGAGDKK